MDTPLPGSEAQKETNIPESITLDGKVYQLKSTPELMDLIKIVGNKERAKLYTAIQALKQELESLKRVEITPEAAQQQPQAAGNDLEKRIEAAVQRAIAPLTEAQHRQQQESLDQYRERILKANEGRCIPMYVTGNTKEELDAALAQSIRVRASFGPPIDQPQGPVVDPLIQEQLRKQQEQNNGSASTTTPTAQSSAAPAAAPTSPTSSTALPSVETPKLTGLPDVSKMSQAEYAKRRDELHNTFQTVLENNAG